MSTWRMACRRWTCRTGALSCFSSRIVTSWILYSSRAIALPEVQQDNLAAMVAISLLGEIAVMEKVESIEVVARLERKLDNRAKPAKMLPFA